MQLRRQQTMDVTVKTQGIKEQAEESVTVWSTQGKFTTNHIRKNAVRAPDQPFGIRLYAKVTSRAQHRFDDQLAGRGCVRLMVDLCTLPNMGAFNTRSGACNIFGSASRILS
jgi:hypothetical protein